MVERPRQEPRSGPSIGSNTEMRSRYVAPRVLILKAFDADALNRVRTRSGQMFGVNRDRQRP